MTDDLDLRTRLIESTAHHHDQKRAAELDGREDDAIFHHRHYQQALKGFNSLGGEA
jgi:hypothetical protein